MKLPESEQSVLLPDLIAMLMAALDSTAYATTTALAISMLRQEKIQAWQWRDIQSVLVMYAQDHDYVKRVIEVHVVQPDFDHPKVYKLETPLSKARTPADIATELQRIGQECHVQIIAFGWGPTTEDSGKEIPNGSP